MGTWVESAACRWLADHGFPECERLPLAGAHDRGDLRLAREPLVIAECKRAQRGVRLGTWMHELVEEVGNAGAAFGLLIAKQRGAGNQRVDRWFAAMPLGDAAALDPRVLGAKELSIMKLNSEYVPALATSGLPPEFLVTRGPAANGVRQPGIAVGTLGGFQQLMLNAGIGVGDGG